MEGPMRTISFSSFPEEEQEIFQLSCRRWWKRPRDFVVTAEEPDSPEDQQSFKPREVTVMYLPSAKARSYRADRGGRWIDDFEDDLQAVYFGRMP
jgi:hypothetical protein